MPLNLDYSTQSEIAIEGMVADSAIVRETRGKQAVANITAGKFVKLDATGLKFEVVSDAADVTFGATRWSPSMVTPEGATVATYKQDTQCPIVTEGSLWVYCNAAVADPQAKLYAIISGSNQGRVSPTASGTTTTAAVCKADGMTTSAAGLVRVKLVQTL
ncbi:hypothetical protein NVP1123O_42 [Vibrio phage 1.123.O._10N.286.48.F3]|nr:hypothetical protein NVP1123O_42 [Vibrio phage 1.123.O._10N.286.48.F3]